MAKTWLFFTTLHEHQVLKRYSFTKKYAQYNNVGLDSTV